MSAHRFYFTCRGSVEDDGFLDRHKCLHGTKAGAKRWAEEYNCSAFEFVVITAKQKEAVNVFAAYVGGKNATHVYSEPGSWKCRKIHPLAVKEADCV